MRVMVLGATGLTGSLVVTELLDLASVDAVVAPVRKQPGLTHPKLHWVQVDFDHLAVSRDIFAVDAVICCLGTTIAKAGSRERFRKVDFDLVVEAASLAREHGAEAFLLMSAVGASAKSSVFYSRVKGECEDAIRRLSFPYLSIYQPGLLLGARDEERLAEGLGQKVMPLLNPLFVGGASKYRGIRAASIARAMAQEIADLAASPAGSTGTFTRQYKDIIRLAGS